MKKLTLACLFLLLFSLGALAKTAVIYHTSDTHGFYYPDPDGIGGFAALSAVLKAERQPYLLLDSGDFSNGTLEAKKSKGLKSVQILNRLGYDAVTLGNHEYSFKDGDLLKIISSLKMPVLAANLRDKATGKPVPGVAPYKVFTVSGVRIGVIGLGTDETEGGYAAVDLKQSLSAALAMLDETGACAAGRELDKEICSQMAAQQKPEVIVVLAHHSINDQRHEGGKFMQTVPELFGGRVHMMLGGHAHNQIPGLVKNGITFVESGYALKGVSRIEVTVDDNTGRFVGAKARYIVLKEKKTGVDPEMKEFVETLRLPGADEKIGVAKTSLTNIFQPKERDTTLSNWAADLIRSFAGTEIGIINNGALRRNIWGGNVLRRDLWELFPHPNSVMKMRLTGEFLRRFLLADAARETAKFSFSGLRALYEKDEQGNIKNLHVWINGKELDERGVYSVATTDYMALGNEEGALFKEIPAGEKEPVGQQNLRDVMEAAFTAGVSAPDTGRVKER